MRGPTGETLVAPTGGTQVAQAISRRRFVRNAAFAAAVGGAAVSSAIFEMTPAEAAGFVPNDQDLHLLRRATWGATPSSGSRSST